MATPEQQQLVTERVLGLGLDNESLTLLFVGLAANESKWICLANLVNHNETFRNYAQAVIDEARRNQVNKIFQTVREIHDELERQHLSGKGAYDWLFNHPRFVSALFGTGSATYYTLAEKTPVIKFLATLVAGFTQFCCNTRTDAISEVCSLVQQGKCISITLAIIPIAYSLLLSVYQWWTGKISAARAGKNVIECLATVVGALAGARAGAAVGLILGPGGAFVGGGIGGIVGGMAGHALAELLTKQIFDLPKDIALENAYKYFNINHCATDAEVLEAYQKRALIDDPDNDGSIEAYCKLQSYISIIRMARGERHG